MQSIAFTLSVANLLVFLASSSSYEDYAISVEELFQDWWEETEEPLQLTTLWKENLESDSVTPTQPAYMVTSEPLQLITWWEEDLESDSVTPNIPDPSVEVYQQVGNSESLIVVCQFKKKTSVSSFHLSVRNSDGKRMLNNPACIAKTTCVFNVTATPPVSFTCVHVVSARTDIQTLLSDVVIYHPHKQLSSAYIGFASFIGVGLVILVIMLVVTTLKTRRKVSRRAVKENVYEPTEII